MHPYKSGYSVLPQLNKISKEEIFQVVNSNRHLEEKKLIESSRKVFFESNTSTEIYQSVCEFLIENYPLKIKGSFQEIAMQMQEDLIIHRLSDESDWFAAAHICFASGWNPEAKIGKPLMTIHSPIPNMNLNNSRKLVEAMVFNGPFERYVWSVVYEDKLDFHPDNLKKSFDSKNPIIFIKVERQVTYGFPEHKAALFILKQSLIPEIDIDKLALHKALIDMTPEQKIYKGITDELISYLIN